MVNGKCNILIYDLITALCTAKVENYATATNCLTNLIVSLDR